MDEIESIDWGDRECAKRWSRTMKRASFQWPREKHPLGTVAAQPKKVSIRYGSGSLDGSIEFPRPFEAST